MTSSVPSIGIVKPAVLIFPGPPSHQKCDQSEWPAMAGPMTIRVLF